MMNGISFTMNNYTENDWHNLRMCEDYQYMVVGKEVSETGTPHLQGYVRLFKRTREATGFKALAALFERRPHMERSRGNAKKNFVYCTKVGGEENVQWFQSGDCPNPGKRNDIRAFVDAIKDGKSKEEILLGDDDGLIGCQARYPKLARDLRQVLFAKEAREECEREFADCKLRAWQDYVIKRVDAQDDRTVTWVYDHTGGKGKSWLARWLETNRGAFGVQGGKQSDIAYAYKRERYVVFDLTRSQEEFVNYGTIEAFKNGRLFSPKYESETLKFVPCKVLVLSNWAPDRAKLSDDRWDVIDIDNPVHRAARSSSSMRMCDDFVFDT